MSDGSLLELKPIPNYPGYFASRDGRIWTTYVKSRRLNGTFEFKIGTVPTPINPRNLSCGHLQAPICRNRKHAFPLVHRLILETFVGPCPSGMECRHLDGNPENNALENLRWGIRKENAGDFHRHNGAWAGIAVTDKRGEKHPQAKLTDDDVRNMRILYETKGIRQVDLAAQFGIKQATVSKILLRQSWSHVA